MLTKRTSKNQVTIPKPVADKFPDVEHFEVEVEDGRIILTPVRTGGAEAVREKLASLGIGENDVSEAIRWARRP
ncbi:MAG: AbrB family transcriptional regulator [Nitrospirae bacterium CG_4_8_14_3_um_filter_70_85]|nr:MAG: AbrB family transcriptional regulator [Nitrospirae bacterium CG_4_8_14_3_um_filter_70_85]PIX84019.1 MAG: AbrB family transcriptional regulator [Nitrospirae bacterium CG_4_10_14_3_um_filter_70_108]